MKCFYKNILISGVLLSINFFELQSTISTLSQLTTHLTSLATYSNNTNIAPLVDTISLNSTWNEWCQQCNKLPFFRDTGITVAATMNLEQRGNLAKGIEWNELEKTIDEFIKVNSHLLSQKDIWLEDAPKWDANDSKNSDSFFKDFEKPLEPFQPFIQKLEVSPQSKIAFHGDFHGDIHSMIQYIQRLNTDKYMNGFEIKDPNFYLVFLGDYEDRGIYGVEVWYTLMRLKIANPEKVIIIRGNHEDYGQCSKDGFKKEFIAKFGGPETTGFDEIPHFNKITRIFDFLPPALYLGSGTQELKNYLLCVHGGLELGKNTYGDIESLVDSHNLLSSKKEFIYQWLKIKPSNEFPNNTAIGLMWSDFAVNPNENAQISPRGAGYVCSKKVTSAVLKEQSNFHSGYEVKGVFRAHQHSMIPTPNDHNIMKMMIKGGGVAKIWPDEENTNKNLWDDIVCTFLVGADTPYGKNHNYNWDGFGILTTAEKYEDWRLAMYQNDIYPKKK